MTISKKFIISAGLFASIAISVAASLPPQQQQEEPKAQNLKVLPKNISHKDLDRIMGAWAVSLGVRCNFCHERNTQTNKMDFASDAKPEKNAARHMFLMMSKINKKYFGAKKDSLGMVMTSGINCYTCHNGKAHPEVVVPAMHMGPPPPPAAAPVGNNN